MNMVLALFASDLDRVFFLSAIFGGLMFTAKLALGLIGGHDGDAGFHDGGSMDGAGHGDFKLFSMQTLSAFFLIFGLSGLAFHRGSHLSETISIVGAFACGGLMMLAIAKLMLSMRDLQTSGTIDVNKAVGRSGMVYLGIPGGGGIGKITIEIGNRLLEMDAMSQDKGAIKTGERVTVTEVVNQNILIVRKFEQPAPAA